MPKDAASRRIDVIEAYLRDMPRQRASRMAHAERAASSLGMSVSYFYLLVRKWQRTGDPASMRDRTATVRAVGKSTRMSNFTLSIMREEIAAAADGDTNIEIRRRIAARMGDASPPSLPTIGRYRRSGDMPVTGSQTDEAVYNALMIMAATYEGIAGIPYHAAVRAAERVARHLEQELVIVPADEIDIRGGDGVVDRLRRNAGERGILILVTGVASLDNPAVVRLRELMQPGDRMAPCRATSKQATPNGHPHTTAA